jgi:hypothetical protein
LRGGHKKGIIKSPCVAHEEEMDAARHNRRRNARTLGSTP